MEIKATRSQLKTRLLEEHQSKLELVGKLIYYNPETYKIAEKFIKADTLSEQYKRWTMLRELVSCSWQEFVKHVEQSEGNYREMFELIDAYIIRFDLNIDFPAGTPYSFK